MPSPVPLCARCLPQGASLEERPSRLALPARCTECRRVGASSAATRAGRISPIVTQLSRKFRITIRGNKYPVTIFYHLFIQKTPKGTYIYTPVCPTASGYTLSYRVLRTHVNCRSTGSWLAIAFGRPERNAALSRSLDAASSQGSPSGTMSCANGTVAPMPLSNYRALPCE